MMRRQDFTYAFDRQTNRRDKHTQCDYDSGNGFRFPVTVRVRLVWRPRSNGQASPNYN